MGLAPFTTYSGQGLRPAIYPDMWKTDSMKFGPGSYVSGIVLGQVTLLTALADVQTLTIVATGGTFRLQDPISGIVTGQLPYNITAAALQTALDLIYGAGGVVVTGGPGATAGLVITAAGNVAAAGPVTPLVVYSNNVAGGAATVTNVHTTTGRAAGGVLLPYASGNTDGTQVAKYVGLYKGSVDSSGFHQFGDATFSSRKLSAPVLIGGYVRTADLTGLDAAAVAQLGRIVRGDIANLTSPGTVLKIN
jgi:hypothetical protein